MPDFCEDYIDLYKAWVHFYTLVHQYMHDGGINLPRRPMKGMSVDHIIALAEQQKAIIGAEAVDEIQTVAKELREITLRLR